jgi:diguanylate cyclase (GGDEF)-like protein
MATATLIAVPGSTDSQDVPQQGELRRRVARVIEERAGSIVNDSLRMFPQATGQTPDPETLTRAVDLVLRSLTAAIRTGSVDARSGNVVGLQRVARERRVPVNQLFGVAYAVERAALDELALDAMVGVTSNTWPEVAQMARRASLDLLGGFAERLSQDAVQGAVSDTLTTLHTRQVLIAVLEKEIQRSERYHHPFALILFDVDHLAAINEAHGYGFGDRVLERIGIVLHNYFREQDWVCRAGSDEFGVLLPETPIEHAELLAERVRMTVHDRMALRDYRTEEQVTVTVSAGIVLAEAVDSSITADQLIMEAEQAVHRAKHAGRDRVVQAAINVHGTNTIRATEF